MRRVDTPLFEQVTSAIEGNPHLTRQQVDFSTESGHVVLRGTVGSYFQKQMAQEAIRRIEGIDRIVNQLEVNWS